MALTVKQERFCQEFLIDGNATGAYRRAGYESERPTEKAFGLVREPEVKERIEQLRAEQAALASVRAQRVVKELVKVAIANIGDVFDVVSGELNSKATPRALASVKEISVTPTKFGPSLRVVMHDKVGALDKLAKILGLSSDINKAIACLASYGINLEQSVEGAWRIRDDMAASAVIEAEPVDELIESAEGAEA